MADIECYHPNCNIRFVQNSETGYLHCPAHRAEDILHLTHDPLSRGRLLLPEEYQLREDDFHIIINRLRHNNNIHDGGHILGQQENHVEGQVNVVHENLGGGNVHGELENHEVGHLNGDPEN